MLDIAPPRIEHINPVAAPVPRPAAPKPAKVDAAAPDAATPVTSAAAATTPSAAPSPDVTASTPPAATTSSAPQTSASPAPTASTNPGQYKAVTGGSETRSGETLLVEAYAGLWILLMGWIFFMWRKQGTLNSRLADLEAAIDRAAAKEAKDAKK